MVGDGFWLGVGVAGVRPEAGVGEIVVSCCGVPGATAFAAAGFTVEVSAGAGCVASGAGVAPEQPNRAARMTRNKAASSFGNLDPRFRVPGRYRVYP